jgi:hypothetical protein
MKKTKLSLLFLFAGVHISSNASGFDIRDLLLPPSAQMVKSILDGNEQKKQEVFNNMLKTPGKSPIFDGIQSLLTSYNNEEYMERGSDLLAEAIMFSAPDFTGYWNGKTTWDGHVVYQNHKLFDMERIMVSPITLKNSKENFGVMVLGDPSVAITGNVDTSAQRLLEGKPAVGPDNANIQLCKLIDKPLAPYYEMSFSDFESITSISKANMLKGISCLNATFSGSYWEKRRNDFIDSGSDSVYPKNTFKY